MLGNIKKLPLISHKAAANRNDAFIVLAALRDGATSMWLFSLGTGPLRCVTLGGPLCARVPMGDDDEIHLHVAYASHFDMDVAFCARMRAAIAAGLESAPIGVITTPGTKNPKYVPTEHWSPSCSSGNMDF